MQRSQKQGAPARVNIDSIRSNELKTQKERILNVLSVFLNSGKTGADKTVALNALSEIESAVNRLAFQLAIS